LPLPPRCHQSPKQTASAILPTKERAMDDDIIQTPDGPMTWAEWKKKNPIQLPSRRTKGKDLPKKVKRFTGDR
jgi:hypothetical protein